MLDPPSTVLNHSTNKNKNDKGKKKEVETIYTSDSSEISVKDSLTEGIILKAPNKDVSKKKSVRKTPKNSNKAKRKNNHKVSPISLNESSSVDLNSVKSLKERPLPILFHQFSNYKEINQKDNTIFNSYVTKKGQGKDIINNYLL